MSGVVIYTDVSDEDGKDQRTAGIVPEGCVEDFWKVSGSLGRWGTR